ncbi:unnamed protein product, partial [Symbiodinium sp. KB8]
MKRLKHPNVVVLHEVINNPKGREFYLVQEYMSAGSVVPEEERVDPLSITLAKRYFRDMLCGLEYLHFQGVIHRDIKPGNILVSEEGRCKIADFGTAAITPQDDDTLSDVQGTPAYWPPELFDPELKSYHGKAVDIWALGATLYTIVVGRPPFLANNQMELAEEVKTKQPAFPSVVQADPYLRDVLERMIEKDPAKRISLADLITHAWVTDEGTVVLQKNRYRYLNLYQSQQTDPVVFTNGLDQQVRP